MRTVLGALAGLLLVAVGWLQPAAAQGMPQGSYLRSCSEVRMRGDTLVAYCRRPDGHGNWTWLNDARRCRGDIGNYNGWLNCNHAGPVAPPPRAEPRDRDRDDRGERRRERCEELRQESRQLRRQIEREFNPIDRARLEGRLQELNERRERCPR